MPDEIQIPWEGKCIEEAHVFAKRCAQLYAENPYSERPLERIINDLMTELWEMELSQTKIPTAFTDAIADMPRYAAGVERRGG